MGAIHVSMSRMSRAARLLKLVQTLRRHRTPVVAQALADELDVSVRSIYRDIGTLREQGASIEGSAGIGFMLRPGFLLPPLMFDDDELEAIVLGLRLAELHGDEGIRKAADDVIAKLRTVLPHDLRTMVDETGLFTGPPLTRPPETVDAAVIRKTLRDSRKARIGYCDGKGQVTERIIWPLALAFFEHSRIVVAWCELRTDFRNFRVDRMRSWVQLPERIGRPRMTLLAEWRKRENIPE
jgi:predicted DNA-binding transcriptional regulator YafY